MKLQTLVFESNTTTYKKTQELSSFELIKCIKILYVSEEVINSNIENCSKKNLINLNKELYKRFIIPFYIPLLVLVPLLLTLSSKENRNHSKVKTLTFILGLFFIIFSEITIRIISDTILKNFTILFMPFLFLLIFYILYFYKTNLNFTFK